MRGSKLGLGVIEILFILQTAFIILKVIGLIGWPWFWVLSPVWVPVLAVMAFISAYMVISAAKDFMEKRKRRKWH